MSAGYCGDFLGVRWASCLTRILWVFVGCFILTSSYADTEVAVRGLTKNSAVVEINGKQRVLKVGKTSPEGVTLISASSKEAVFEIDGEQKTLGITRQQGFKSSETQANEFRIPRGNNGHFFVSGKINNRTSRFIVDTGATSIAMSSVEAKRLGLQYKKGERVRVATASNNNYGYRIVLNSVTVGSISVHQIEAIVMPGRYPEIILLGNSFLNKVNYQVDEGVLILEAKY